MATVLIQRTMPAFPGAPVIGTVGGDAPEMYSLEDPYILAPGVLPQWWPQNRPTISPQLLSWPYTAIKLPGVTAIPAGKYRAVMCMSQRFKMMLPYLQDVPSFTGILMHIVNTQEDTAGCIGVGKHRVSAKAIGASEIAIAELRKWWLAAEKEGPVWVEIVNPAP